MTTIETLLKMKAGGAFASYIDYIRFPHYKNLRPNTKISFNFPLTVLIGQNGTGKSGTLQAMYGAPRDYSVGNFWFSTEIDPIQETKNGLRHCFIYGYRSSSDNSLLEVLKIRIKRKGNPNYWEPSRPYKIYGMTGMSGKRNPAIEMNVVYLDFRGILSAFDKCFYFGSLKGRNSKTKQDYILNKSRQLKIAIGTNQILKTGGKPQNELPIQLSKDEIKSVSKILGREYSSAITLRHAFYDGDGTSVLFETPHYNYSEAFAGSGETKVVMLVYSISRAEDGSLILLDEPEVSLHPGAQKRLQEYLLEQAKSKRLQVIVSSHSPHLVAGLPPDAIKVFVQHSTGEVEVQEGYTPEQSFFVVGHEAVRYRIIVEDSFSRKIVYAGLKAIGNNADQLFDVVFFPGGADSIKKSVPFYARHREPTTFIVLDGDQNRVPFAFDPASLPVSSLTQEFLGRKIFEQTNVDLRFDVDGQSGNGRQDQRIAQQIAYLEFWKDHVLYLPKQSPEEIIWNVEYGEQLVRLSVRKEHLTIIKDISELKTAKEKLHFLSTALFNDNLEAVHDLFIAYARENESSAWTELLNLLRELVIRASTLNSLKQDLQNDHVNVSRSTGQ